MPIKKDFLIEKLNVLNDLRSNNLTLQELRFFSIYLAKINARDITTRTIMFSLSDFQRIMELGRLNLVNMRNAFSGLLCKIVHKPLETGGFMSFQLFKTITLLQTKENDWFVEIDAHDDALPLMFEFKERYFTYELWNALRLKSTNQLRMYEILKQYEKTGERILPVQELKELLGINANDYARYGDFKTHVLTVCQRALAEYTDIKYTFEPTGKKGKGGKVLTLKFTIEKNTDYTDRISLNEFIDRQTVTDDSIATGTEASLEERKRSSLSDIFSREIYPFLAEACENEFNQEEIQVLYNLAVQIIPYKNGRNAAQLEIYNYLKRKYDELQWRAGMTKISSRMGYIKKIIEADVNAG